MAKRLGDGSIQLSNGKQIFADTPLLDLVGQDLTELVSFLTPPQHFVGFTGRGGGGAGGGPGGGGGGAGAGPRGFQGLAGLQGFQGSGGGGGGGAFEFVEKITVAGAPVQSVTFSGLDGDADVNYWLKAMFKSDPLGGFTSLILKPNDLTTDQSGVRITSDGTTVSTAPLTRLRIGDLASHPSHTYAEIFFRASREGSSPRTFWCDALEGIVGALKIRQQMAVWNSIAANLTSLVLEADVSDSIGPGSIFELYRIVPQ